VVGDLERPDHRFLTKQDECYYFGDYVARAGYAHSPINQLILNLKKSASHRGEIGWHYKSDAIEFCAELIAKNLDTAISNHCRIVPIPPSKPPRHSQYDDRMWQIAKAAKPFKASALLNTVRPRTPFHSGASVRDVDLIFENLEYANFSLDMNTTCILIDDVLATGANFKACKRKLLQIPQINKVIGIFISRCRMDSNIGSLGYYIQTYRDEEIYEFYSDDGNSACV
jgi:predicted amidophosphoribosyltransferase